MLAAALVILGAWSSMAASAAPLEAYGRLPALDDVAIAPDGKSVAFLTNIGSTRVIEVQSVDTHAVLDTIQAGQDKLRGLDWANNDTLLINVSNSLFMGWYGEAELMTTVSFNIHTRGFFNLLKNANHAAHVEAGLPMPLTVNGKVQVYVPGATLSGLSGVLTMFAVDPNTGDVTELEDGTKYTEGFAVDAAGSVVARADYDDDKKHWSLLMKRGGTWREIFGADATIETPDLVGLGPDGKTLIVHVLQNGAPTYRQFNLADGSQAAPLNIPGGATLLNDPVTRLPIAAVTVDDRYHYAFFSAADQSIWNQVLRDFPGEDVQFVSWSADRKRVVVLVNGKADGSSYDIVDPDTGHADLLGPAYAGIGPDDIAEVRAIRYTAADGLTIPAFLTLPKGKPATNLPLVVLPHGGPAARDMPGFDWWPQALASRGYAVLQPQFRGSDGYGWPLLAAGFGEWGRKMQSDLSDGVRYLTAQGIVDAKRVCIVGASYGGYAALAGVTLQHGIYRCAVSVSGISDPMSMMSHSPGEGRGERYLERFMGVTGYNDRKLDEISPLSHTAAADVPVLLIHGTHDAVVNYTQSQFMHDAMKRDGKTVTFILLDSEDHWMSRGGTRQIMLSKTVEFLEQNNPPN